MVLKHDRPASAISVSNPAAGLSPRPQSASPHAASTKRPAHSMDNSASRSALPGIEESVDALPSIDVRKGTFAARMMAQRLKINSVPVVPMLSLETRKKLAAAAARKQEEADEATAVSLVQRLVGVALSEIIVNKSLVLVIGAPTLKESGHKDLFCRELVSAVGGSMLCMATLVTEASNTPGVENEEVKSLVLAKKVVPFNVQEGLLKRAMQTRPAPFVMSDFPRMRAHLSLLEAAVGEVNVAIHLTPSAYSEAEDRMGESVLKPLRDSCRVHTLVFDGDLTAAVADAVAALKRAGVPCEGLAAAAAPKAAAGPSAEEETAAAKMQAIQRGNSVRKGQAAKAEGEASSTAVADAY